MPIDMSTRTTQDVEVLIDETPVRRHHDVGELRAIGRDEATCLHAMQQTAASAGIDGFYSISCGSDGTQQCTARAFVYEE